MQPSFSGPLASLAPTALPFADLINLPVHRLLERIDGLPGADDLSPLQRSGLATLMATRGIEPVIRNNIANRLVGAADADPALWRTFLAMAQDPAEDEVWRDYAIQFLALATPRADDRAAAGAALLRIATDDPGTRGTTALLHLVRLGREGILDRPASLPALVASRIQDPATPDPARHVALALVGQEGWTEQVPLVRSVLAAGLDIDATRGALYTLGMLGDAGDMVVIERYRSATHPAVAAAARAAHDRVVARFGSTAAERPQ
ncbi:MAG: hypothetical protein RLZZ127_299 [Planctomycetota bacterium]|jgi:hypothetical protein